MRLYLSLTSVLFVLGVLGANAGSTDFGFGRLLSDRLKNVGIKEGWCLKSNGADQNTGQKVLGRGMSSQNCITLCKHYGGATGCELSVNGGVCSVHTREVASGNGNSNYECSIFPQGGIKQGFCLDRDGADQNAGQIVLASHMSSQDCIALCKRREGATACELSKNGGVCSVHTREVASGNGNSNYECLILS